MRARALAAATVAVLLSTGTAVPADAGPLGHDPVHPGRGAVGVGRDHAHRQGVEQRPVEGPGAGQLGRRRLRGGALPLRSCPCLLGGENCDGECKIKVKVPEGAQPGQTVRLRGKGMPSLRTRQRGDLVVQLDVETPTRLDERQEELLRELAALRDEESPDGHVQAAHKSVFGRLRDAFNPR